MSEYPELRAFVDDGYTYVRSIDGIAIYERKPADRLTLGAVSTPVVLR
jgi:hypothetical protein